MSPGASQSGAEGNRTPDLLDANETLSQLSYGPFGHHCTPRLLHSGRGTRRSPLLLKQQDRKNRQRTSRQVSSVEVVVWPLVR